VTSNPLDPKCNAGWLHRFVQVTLHAVGAVAAVLGISLKLGVPDAGAAPAQRDALPESGRVDPQKPATEEASSSLNTLLQGTWSAPPQLAARGPETTARASSDTDPGKTKFDDLGFISHIDSGFHDFADH